MVRMVAVLVEGRLLRVEGEGVHGTLTGVGARFVCPWSVGFPLVPKLPPGNARSRSSASSDRLAGGARCGSRLNDPDDRGDVERADHALDGRTEVGAEAPYALDQRSEVRGQGRPTHPNGLSPPASKARIPPVF